MDSNHQPSDLESGTLPIGVTDAFYCIPDKIPTCNLRFRKTLLYAVELREQLYTRKDSNPRPPDSYSGALIHLSYKCILCVWAGSNCWPLESQSNALPTELHTPYSTVYWARTNPEQDMSPPRPPGTYGILAESTGIEPNTFTGTSRLAGGPYRRLGLLSNCIHNRIWTYDLNIISVAL